MKNKNKLSQKMRNFKKLAEFAAKLQRDPRTKNFVGFAAVVVLVCVAFSFATDTPNETEKPTQLTVTRQISVPIADSYTHDPANPKKTTTMGGQRIPVPGKISVIKLSETEDTIICTVGSYLFAHQKGKTITLPMEIPKDSIAEYGGTPGGLVKPAVFLTLSRAVRFPDGSEMKAGTTIKAIKWPEQNDSEGFTFLAANGTPWEISSKSIAELKGATGEPEVARPSNLERNIRDLQRNASLQEIIDSAKAGTELTRSAREMGEKIKSVYYNGAKYISEVDNLKEITTPVTGTEQFSLRPEFEKLNIRPRKANWKNFQDVCSLHAVSVAFEYLYKKEGISQDRLSLAYLRWLAPSNPKRQGADPVLIIEETNHKGISSEQDFPYSRMGTTPSSAIQAKAQARTNKKVVIRGASNTKLTWTDLNYPPFEFPISIWGNNHFEISNQIIMHELKKGNPVLVACSFPSGVEEGDMTQKRYKRSVPHAVLVVGYKTKDGTVATTVYEFINSRGETWGYQGYGIWDANSMLSAQAYSLSLE